MTSAKEDKREEKYCKAWEEEQDLKTWLQPVPGDEGKVACRFCACKVHSDYFHLQQHMTTAEHRRLAAASCALSPTDGEPRVSKKSGLTATELSAEASHSSPGSQKMKEEDKCMVANGPGNLAGVFPFSAEPTLEDIRRLQSAFTEERGWGRYHQPRNLLLALVGEVGELAELFQWREETPEGLPGWTVSERESLSDELSDVLIYLVALAEKCHVDLPSAALRKIDKNRLKYPAEKVYGSSKKYTEYQK